MPAGVMLAQGYEQAYVAAYALRRGELAGGPALARVRDAAIERFAALGFPTTHDEEWKYTNLTPFLKVVYEPAPSGALVDWPSSATASPVLAFVNGRFAPELSSALPVAGLKLSSLKDAIEQGRLLDHIARYAAFETNAMAALNTAMFEDGALVEIADGAVIDAPIELLFMTAANGRPVACYPRNLILAGRDSQARIIETYRAIPSFHDRSEAGGEASGPPPVPYFTNAVTELVAAEGAIIEHYRVQEEGLAALHFGMLAAHQGANSHFTSHNIALGGALARNEIAAVLDGEGSECALNGLYVTAGAQHVDNHTTLDHARPHCSSRELYKGILDGRSQGVFHGRIIVRPEAQKTDAIQRNKNLLLSRDAVINTKPQLEIYADDVRCTHGATVGQVDEEAVFYLCSRGIPLEEARSLLTYAFTADLLDAIQVEPLRVRLRAALLARLSGKGDRK
ncbi:MAG: Fe-S cluster assembly protein SufD [Bryobacteraceae bacterium]